MKKAKQRPKRQKVRYQRHKKVYGFVKQRPTRRGVLSLMIYIMTLLFWLGAIVAAFITEGQLPGIVGALGLTSVFFSVAGIYLARKSLYEQGRSYKLSRVMLVLNSVQLLMTAGTFILGLR